MTETENPKRREVKLLKAPKVKGLAIVQNKFPDDDRKTSGIVVRENYKAWTEAIDYCSYLIEKGIIVAAEFEDPDVPQIWHGCLFSINGNVDLDEIEIVSLAAMIARFDALTIISDDEIVSCSATQHIYKEN